MEAPKQRASSMVQELTDTIFDSGNTVTKPLVKKLAESMCSLCHYEASKDRKDYWYQVIKEIRKI